MSKSSRAARGAAVASASAAHASVKKASRAPVAVSRGWTSLLALVCQSGPGGVSLQRRWLLSPPKSVVATLIADHFLHVRVAYHPASGQLCALFTDIARSFGIGNNAWNPSQPNRFPAALKIQLDGNVIWALPLSVLAEFIVWAHRINQRVLFQSGEPRPTQARAFLVQALDLLRDLSAHIPLHPQPPSLPEMRSLLESFMGGSDYAHIGRAVFQTADGSVLERHADGTPGLPLALSAYQEEQKRTAPAAKQERQTIKASKMEENRQLAAQGLPPKRSRQAKGKAAALDKPLGKKKKQSKGGQAEMHQPVELSLAEQEEEEAAFHAVLVEASLKQAQEAGYQLPVPLQLLVPLSAAEDVDESLVAADDDEEDEEGIESEGEEEDEQEEEGDDGMVPALPPLPPHAVGADIDWAQVDAENPHGELNAHLREPSAMDLSSAPSSPLPPWARDCDTQDAPSRRESAAISMHYSISHDAHPLHAPEPVFPPSDDNDAVDGHFGAMGPHEHTHAYASFSEAAAAMSPLSLSNHATASHCLD